MVGQVCMFLNIKNNKKLLLLRCQVCPYASRNSSQLIVHLRTHTGDSPFECKVCHSKFKINSDLKRHMRVHTGEKPYQCDSCDYKCSIKGKHMLNSNRISVTAVITSAPSKVSTCGIATVSV